MARIPFPLRRSILPLRAPLCVAVVAACSLMAPWHAGAQQLPPEGAGRIAADKPQPPGANAGLSAELFYKFMLAEVALQRGDMPVAARAYYEAAREMRDARVARRATEIALASRQRALAIESATLWAALDPEAMRPKQIVASLSSGASGKDLAESGVDDEIRDRLQKLLSDAAVSGQGVGEVFLQINRYFAQQPERKQVYELIRSLAKPYPANPEAHFAVAYSAFGAEIPASEGVDPALAEVNRALELKPGLGAGGAAQGRYPRARFAGVGRRVPQAVRRRQSGRQVRRRRAGAGLCRAEALCRSTRHIPEALGQRAQRAGNSSSASPPSRCR